MFIWDYVRNYICGFGLCLRQGYNTNVHCTIGNWWFLSMLFGFMLFGIMLFGIMLFGILSAYKFILTWAHVLSPEHGCFWTEEKLWYVKMLVESTINVKTYPIILIPIFPNDWSFAPEDAGFGPKNIQYIHDRRDSTRHPHTKIWLTQPLPACQTVR